MQNKIVEQAEQEKAVNVNIIFLIDVNTVEMVAKEKSPWLNQAWNHPNEESWRK